METATRELPRRAPARRRTQAERTARSDARMLDAAVALIGAVNMVAMFQLVQTGEVNVEKTNRELIPQLVQGLLPRQP